MRSAGSLVVVCALLGLSGCGEPARGEVLSEVHGALAVATLADAQGDVRHTEAGTAVWQSAEVGLVLAPDDAVQTMAESTALVRFAGDASEVRIEPLTTLRVQPPADDTLRITHVAGHLRARVGPGSDQERLEVNLPPGALILDGRGGAVEARVEVDNERTAIAMLQGEASLRRREGGTLDLPEQTFVDLSETGEVLDSGEDLPAPVLVRPAAGDALRVRRSATFSWEPVEGAEDYELRLHRDGQSEEHVVASPRAALEVEGGDWTWQVRGRRGERGGRWSALRSVSVEVDRTAPQLRLSHPQPGVGIAQARLVVAGRTEPGALVSVNGDPVEVGRDGRFRTSITIARGLFNLVVRGEDDLGNVRVVTRSVARYR